MLALITGAHTRMRGKEQLTVSIYGVTVEQDVWV